MDVEAARTLRGVDGEEAIALGQKVFQTACDRFMWLAGGTVAAHELCRWPERRWPSAFVLNPSVALDDLHVSQEIRQVKHRSRHSYRDWIRGLETEEKYARHTVHAHVRAYVQFRKCRDPRQRRHGARRNVAHVKGHD